MKRLWRSPQSNLMGKANLMGFSDGINAQSKTCYSFGHFYQGIPVGMAMEKVWHYFYHANSWWTKDSFQGFDRIDCMYCMTFNLDDLLKNLSWSVIAKWLELVPWTIPSPHLLSMQSLPTNPIQDLSADVAADRLLLIKGKYLTISWKIGLRSLTSV